MKKQISLLILLVSVAFSGYSEGKVEWLNTVHDFGTFEEEIGNVSCSMKFVNTGDSDLVIMDVRPTCGCTAADYTRSAIEPGDTGVVNLVFNPIGRPGKFSKDVIVMTNGEPGRSVLEIKGNVVGAMNTMQSKFPVGKGELKFENLIIPFGKLQMGKQKTVILDAYNQSKDTLTIKNKNIPSHIKLESIPKIIPPGAFASFSVYYNTNKKKDWGPVKDEVKFEILNLSKGTTTEETIDVVAIIEEDFSKLTDNQIAEAPQVRFSESSFNFGMVNSTEPVSVSIKVENLGKKNLIIRKAYTFAKGVEVTQSSHEIKKGKYGTITVTVDPKEIAGDFIDAKINIITNDPLDPLRIMRAVGEFKR